MPKTIIKISASILEPLLGNTYFFSQITGAVQGEDYIDLPKFVAYLQNFTQVYSYETLSKPLTFGLKNQYNLPTITLEISY